ncbi:MAG: hypothetical protein ACRDVW_05745 [Acidimicrobiales bacterium]
MTQKVAFENIAAHLEAGAGLAFACWQPVAENRWCVGPVLAPFLTPLPRATDGGPAPGPFVFGDVHRVTAVLESVGFGHVEGTADEQTLNVPRRAIVSVDQLHAVPEVHLDVVTGAVEEVLAPLARGDGTYDVPLAFWVFTAVLA